MRFLLCCIAFLAASAATAQDSSALWQSLTRNDIEAAYAQLRDDHPGTVTEAGDPGMITRLEQAHAKALDRVPQVTDFDGYSATLGEFANSLGDGHLRSALRYTPRVVYWAGLIMAKHGPDWVVANEDAKAAGADLLGAHLLSCDGVAVNDLARDALKFRTNVAVEALMVLRAPWLLVDEGNPFLRRPKNCEFDKGGTPTVISLKWTRIARADLLDRHWHKPYGEAGFEVRSVDGAAWIGLGDLSGKAQAVIDAVTAKAEEIRHSAYVVVDVRGNGGGDDAYGRSLAAALYGADYAAEKLGPEDAAHGGCDEVFRASPDNIRTIGSDVDMMERTGDSAGAAQYRKAVESMKRDAEKGKALSGDLGCKAKPTSAKTKSKPLMTGKVFLLTDSACFSSCLQVASFFRTLGAVHVGLTTAADTHYSEVTDVTLPSGLSSFSTLRAYMPDYALALGPFVPAYAYEGDIADTAAVEKWVAKLASERR